MPKKVLLKTLAILLPAALIPIAALAYALLSPAPTWLRLTIVVMAISWIGFGTYALYLLWPQWDGWLFDQRKRHRGQKIAALTFDDGPDEPWTRQILDILRQEGVLATFFVLGEKAKSYPEMVQLIADEGHDVGNHTMSHRILTHRGTAFAHHEIARASETIAKACGQRPALFRAPHGFKSPSIRPILKEQGLKLIPWTKGLWEIDGAKKPTLLKRFRKRFSKLEILLLHDGVDSALTLKDRSATVETLPGIIAEYRRRGYRFMSIGELIGGKQSESSEQGKPGQNLTRFTRLTGLTRSTRPCCPNN